MELTRINNDTNGNPRYVAHFLNFVNEADRAKTNGQVGSLYALALNKARKIGGKKFHNKQYGGGIVFQSYNTNELMKDIERIKSS